MFFLLYKHTDDGVFDNFPKISNHFPKISEDLPKLFRRPDDCSRTFSENFRKFPKMSEDMRRLPKTFEEDPKMFRSYTNEFKYNLRDKQSSISSLRRMWKIRHLSPGCSFICILRVVNFPVKHTCNDISCLYAKSASRNFSGWLTIQIEMIWPCFCYISNSPVFCL